MSGVRNWIIADCVQQPAWACTHDLRGAERPQHERRDAPCKSVERLGDRDDVRGTGENELSRTPVPVYDPLQCQGSLRETRDLVDDDRQRGLSGLRQDRTEPIQM